MTVKELIEELRSFPEDMTVVFCSDSNNFMEYCDSVDSLRIGEEVTMYYGDDEDCVVMSGSQCGKI